MDLQELQNFVFDFGRVSLAEIEICFQANGDTIRPMLDRLIKKGRVQRSSLDEKCQTCLKCEPDELEFYEWIASPE